MSKATRMTRNVLAALVLLAAPAFAQDAAPSAALTALIAADKDKDGRWTKQEWVAAGRREAGFAFIDADRDGYVTRPELAAGV